ncbi:hypothetical protein A2U01_0051838 [Trifolium medium]|uniref:Uncharacterized protein n=1 Tax=Trifolium medium TaxID=97028 RepID=A0A392R2Z5_9FABA|nr:hypothetical protein [Trifolium medium]
MMLQDSMYMMQIQQGGPANSEERVLDADSVAFQGQLAWLDVRPYWPEELNVESSQWKQDKAQ